MLCYSREGLCASLTTLPSEALQTEALKLFKVMWEWNPGLLDTGAQAQPAQLNPIPAQENYVVTGWPKGCERKSHRVPFVAEI